MLKFTCYPKCTTCRKARKWLECDSIGGFRFVSPGTGETL